MTELRGADRQSEARSLMRARRYRTLARVTILGAFGSALACSLLLTDTSIPCTSDADCLKFQGARCDLSAQHCVAGDIGDATSPADVGPGLDAPQSPDVTEASVPPADGSVDAADAAPDAPVDTGVDVTVADAAPETGDGEAGSPPDTGPDVDAAEAGPRTTIDWNALAAYLDSLYTSSVALVQRTPGSGLYYASPDNALAQRAFLYLPTPDNAKSTAIYNRLNSLEVCGCSDAPGHSGLINHQFDPLVQQGWTIPLTPGSPCFGKMTEISQSLGCTEAPDGSGPPFCGANIMQEDRPVGGADGGSPEWYPDTCNGACGGGLLTVWSTSGSGAGYADLIALEILNYRNHHPTLSTTGLWASLQTKLDMYGVNDSVNASDGFYSTYKLALYRLAARAVGQPVPAVIDAQLVASQGPNGGIRTNYNSTTGAFSLDQQGDAKTTALVVLAFLLPDSAL